MMDPERISTPHYFGGTKFKDGKMVRFIEYQARSLPGLAPSDDQRRLSQAVMTAFPRRLWAHVTFACFSQRDSVPAEQALRMVDILATSILDRTWLPSISDSLRANPRTDCDLAKRRVLAAP